tara:strand:+ start:1048 stop:1305 length:258 start_codon:yes stop_codon:yes gene_type:complete
MSVKRYFYKMTFTPFFKNTTRNEILFQILLHIVVFLFFSFDRYEPEIQGFKIVTFLNYALGALVSIMCCYLDSSIKKNTFSSFVV